MTTATAASSTDLQDTGTQASDTAVWKDARQVRAHFGGRSAMWLHRKKRDRTFPTATYFGRRKFFRVSEITAWERRQTELSALRALTNTD
jgi:predicted DNA-binding transcriptional regulator AlpA